MRRPDAKFLSLLRLFACFFILISASQTAGFCENVTQTNDVTFSITSPKDGSLWLGTASRGLLRLGATGRSFTYSTLTGHLECDSIVSLAFDENGLLWVRDARDVVLTYSTQEGFVQRSELPVLIREALFPTILPEPAEMPVEEHNKQPATWPWVLVIVCLIAVICGLLYYILRKREQRPEIKTEALPQPAVKSEAAARPRTLFEVPDFEGKVREIIEKNYMDKDFSVDQIASELGISRVHLSRKLKAISAASPSDMIKARRMEEAARLLRSGEKNMATVAASCGFASSAYFSSAFKAFYGVAPSAFN